MTEDGSFVKDSDGAQLRFRTSEAAERWMNDHNYEYLRPWEER